MLYIDMISFLKSFLTGIESNIKTNMKLYFEVWLRTFPGGVDLNQFGTKKKCKLTASVVNKEMHSSHVLMTS